MKNISFYNLVSQWEIEVPIFQRDYAQGRDNNKAEDVRKTIVSAMIDAVTKDKCELFFDFVYGRIDNGIFIPFDGQQRLTTLYLFHRYIFEKCKEAKYCSHAESCTCTQLLKKFSYETRQSSREFCEKLVSNNCIPDEEDEKFKKYIQIHPENKNKIMEVYIKEQPWFYSDWEKDPTIDGMVRLLDEIHNQIKEKENFDYKNIAERLTSGCSCPITFHLVDMGKYKLPDATYVKMNARGKTLTAFENFKASLEEYLEKPKVNEPEESKSERIALLNTWKENIDGTWLDFFWKEVNFGKNGNEKTVPDALMMSFINRYLMNVWRNYYAKFEKKDKDADKELNQFIIDKLLFYPTNDTFISFNEIYEPILNRCGIAVCLKPILNFWTELIDNKHSEIIDNCRSVWERNKNDGWNLFVGNKNDNRETYQSRIAFYAIILFFKEGGEDSYNEKGFKRWMRVVWNIIENSAIDSPQTYESALILIHELSNQSHEIYTWLKDNKFGPNHAQIQIKEEREKALQICDDKSNSWEEKIEEAERHAFFKGAIRFLFTGKDGKYDWNLFNDRLDKSKLYFDNNGITSNYKNNAILLRLLISGFSDWAHFYEINYDNSASNWKENILTNKKLLSPLGNLFSFDKLEEFNIEDCELYFQGDDKQRLVHYDLCKSKLLTKIEQGCYLHTWWGSYYLLYPHNVKAEWKKYVIGTRRNQILTDAIKDNRIVLSDKNQHMLAASYFWGKSVGFTYQGKIFVWDCADYIKCFDTEKGKRLEKNDCFFELLNELSM